MNSTEVPNGYPGVDEKLEPIVISGLPIAGAGLFMFSQRRREARLELEKASLLPYCEDIQAVLSEQDYAVVGGLPIDAFNHEATTINVEGRIIAVSEVFNTPLLRKTNHTVRDFDILMFNKDGEGKLQRFDKDARKSVNTLLKETVKSRAADLHQPAPIVSLFSFDKHPRLANSATIVSEDGGLSLQQGYVKQELPETTMELWKLILANGTTIQVLNPWEQYWRSMIRYSSGMKPKDREKLDIMLYRLRNTQGLAEMKHSELCNAYQTFYDNMTAQNNFSTVREAMRAPERDWSRVIRLGELAAASSIMKKGQSLKSVEKLVQSSPRFFDHFVGSK